MHAKSISYSNVLISIVNQKLKPYNAWKLTISSENDTIAPEKKQHQGHSMRGCTSNPRYDGFTGDTKKSMTFQNHISAHSGSLNHTKTDIKKSKINFSHLGTMWPNLEQNLASLLETKGNSSVILKDKNSKKIT